MTKAHPYAQVSWGGDSFRGAHPANCGQLAELPAPSPPGTALCHPSSNPPQHQAPASLPLALASRHLSSSL